MSHKSNIERCERYDYGIKSSARDTLEIEVQAAFISALRQSSTIWMKIYTVHVTL